MVHFSKLDIKNLDKMLSKLINLAKSKADIPTHLSHKDFGINIRSLLLLYIHCIGQQLIQTLINQGQLSIICQVLAQHLCTKYGGSQHLPKLQHQACVRSPMFMLKENMKYK